MRVLQGPKFLPMSLGARLEVPMSELHKKPETLTLNRFLNPVSVILRPCVGCRSSVGGRPCGL